MGLTSQCHFTGPGVRFTNVSVAILSVNTCANHIQKNLLQLLLEHDIEPNVVFVGINLKGIFHLCRSCFSFENH